MRRIKHYCWNDTISTPVQHQTINANDLAMIHIRDYRLLLRVARAADGLKYDSGVRVKWPDWLLPLEAALDALNARKGKP